MKKSNTRIGEIIGDPKRLDDDLNSFRKDTEVLSSRKANLIDKYPKRWVAIYNGGVRANAPSLNSLLKMTDDLGIPREHVVVRLVDRDVRRMIL